MSQSTRRFLAVGCVTTLAAVAGAAELPFGARHSISTSYSGAGSLVSGDIDGDGLDDLVAAGLTHSSLSWWQSLGDGTFAINEVVASAVSLDDVELADIDADGDLDVLVTATVPINAVGWYKNTGTPTAGAWPLNVIAVNFGGASGSATGDFNGDGHLDVVGVALNADHVTVALNATGDGAAWSYEPVDPAFDGARWVSTGDIDGDGTLDIAAAAFDSGEVAWWSRSLAGMWSKHGITVVAGADVLELADMDYDGDLDALGAAQTGAIRWWENHGSGGAWTEHIVGDPTGNVSSAYPEDLDLDGDPDVIYSAYGADGVGWYENTSGDGRVWQQRVIDGTFSQSFDVTAGDFDGDGDPDLAAVDIVTNEVASWENLSNHRSASYPSETTLTTAASQVRDSYTVDFDGDGDLDLMFADSGLEQAGWYENTAGDGSSWTIIPLKTSFEAMAITAANFDCNGTMDGAAASDSGFYWWEQSPSGAITEHSITTSATTVEALDTADIDRDGDPDLVLGSFTDGIHWYENACGAFLEHFATMVHIIDADSMTVADIDGDGDPDIVLSDYDQVRWSQNNLEEASSNFSAPMTIAGSLTNTRGVAAGDVDGDGDTDVVSFDQASGEVIWWPNSTGDGSAWGSGITVGTGLPKPQVVRLYDLDQDGDLDVVASAEDQGPDVKWLGWFENGDGAGSFWTTHVIADDVYRVHTLGTGDFDRDGAPDIVQAGSGTSSPQFWRNRGGQALVGAAPTAPATLDPLILGDVLEFVVAHRGRVGDADLELASIDLLLTDSGGTPLVTAEAESMLHGIYVFEDDDDSADFDPALDTEIAQVETFSLTDGIQTVGFIDGDSHVRVPHSSPSYFFVAIAFEPDAALLFPSEVQVTMKSTEAVVEEADHDLPMSLEWRADVASGVVHATHPDLLFADDFESGGTSNWTAVSP